MKKLAIIGLGKLGSCLAGVLAHVGHHVVGIDTDSKAAHRMMTRDNPEPSFAELDIASLAVTTDFSRVGDAEMSFVIVPTPSKKDGSFDDAFLRAALCDIGKHAQPGHVCVVVSTVSPGTMRKQAVLWASPVPLVYSPLFVALGTVIRDLRSPDIRLIGTERSGDPAGLAVANVLRTLDAGKADVVRLTWEEAEIAKLATNAAIVQKVAFANMIAAACQASEHTDPRAILAAVGKDKRIGQLYLRPGAPPSGPCFPRDSVALAEWLERSGVNAIIPKSVTMFNRGQVSEAVRFLGGYKTVAILGLAYKPGTPVTEESMGATVGEMLASKGVKVIAHDPMAKTWLCRVADPKDAIAQADAVLIATPHSEYVGISTMGKPTLDPWGCTDGIKKAA